jgi:hypothetical protein
MAKTKSFDGVTPAVWQCVKTTSLREHGTIYEPDGSPQGTATTRTPVGEVVLRYDYSEEDTTVTYTIEKKPFIVSDDTIWDGIKGTLKGCSFS